MPASKTDYTTNFEKTTDVNTLVPYTRAVITPAITISVNGKKIGFIQNFTPTQNRPANPMYEVGTEGIIEHVPGQPTYTFSLTKLAVYRNNLLKVFQSEGALSEAATWGTTITDYLTGRGGTTGDIYSVLVDLPIPFDIQTEELDPTTDNVLIVKYPDCILTSYSKPINAAGDLTIAETANGVCRKPKYSA